MSGQIRYKKGIKFIVRKTCYPKVRAKNELTNPQKGNKGIDRV